MDDSPERQRDRTRDALLVQQWRSGDDRAYGGLYDAWFDRVHDLVRRIVADPDLAAEVTQDAFLAAWRRIDSLEDPASFGGWLLRIARNRALNLLERERRSTTVGDDAMQSLEAGGTPMSAPVGFRFDDSGDRWSDPATAVEDAELVAFLWGAADALGERDRTVLDLTLRHQMTPAEIGEVVGVNRNAANQLVHRVKGRLDKAVSARSLWRDGAPACDELRVLLVDGGIDAFDGHAVAAINRHADGCGDCGVRRERRLAPAAMFGALPVMVAPLVLKQQAAAALEAAGVPMGGSVYAGVRGVGPDSDPACDSHGPRDPGRDVPGPATDGPVGSDGGPATLSESDADRSGPIPRGYLVLAGLGGLVLFVVAALVLLGPGGGSSASDDLALTDTVVTVPPTTSPTSMMSVGPQASPLPALGHPTVTTQPPASPSPPTTVAPADTPLAQPGPEVIPPMPPPPVPPPATSPPPTSPRPTDPQPPPVVTALSVVLTPDSASPSFVVDGADQPMLTWQVSGDAPVVVQVQGPGLDSDGREGSVPVCPGVIVSSVCRSQSGSYDYRVQVFDGQGNVLFDQVRTLVITPTFG